jgi:protein tyrosine/serine phosphatase
LLDALPTLFGDEVSARLSRSTGIAVTIGVAVWAAFAQSGQSHRELPNFHQVSPVLFRGAQPKEGGIRKLAELGVKTIVSLRGEDEESRADEREARTAGLRYVRVPMNGLSRPTDEQVERVLGIINTPENQPVFVHCKHGSDRTGTVIAVYRISHDGWNARRALSEAKECGMNWIQFGMKDYISDYYRDSLRGKDHKAATTGVATSKSRQ